MGFPEDVATVLHRRGRVVTRAVYRIGHTGGESYADRDPWRVARPEGRSPACTAGADRRHFPETAHTQTDAAAGAAPVEHRRQDVRRASHRARQRALPRGARSSIPADGRKGRLVANAAKGGAH